MRPMDQRVECDKNIKGNTMEYSFKMDTNGFKIKFPNTYGLQ